MFGDEDKLPEEIDKFTSTVEKLQPRYKSGLAKQMFVENQIAAITSGIVRYT